MNTWIVPALTQTKEKMESLRLQLIILNQYISERLISLTKRSK